MVDGMRLRGIIDRLDLAARRKPHRRGLQDRAGTVGALRARQHGRGPDLRAAVRERARAAPRPRSGSCTCASRWPSRRWPSEQTIRGQRKRAVAVWTAIERACDAEDFRPHVGPAVRPLPLQGFLPRVRRVTGPTMSTLDEAVDAAFEPLRGQPAVDRAAVRRLQPGRLRPHLGAAGRPQGAPPRAGPAARRRGARRRPASRRSS